MHQPLPHACTTSTNTLSLKNPVFMRPQKPFTKSSAFTQPQLETLPPCACYDIVFQRKEDDFMATASTNINIRVDSDIKTKAQDVFSSMGLDMTTAINIFLRQAIRKNAIPFRLVADSPQKTPKLGCMKGKIWMSEDFDEPLEDFKEYM